MTYRQMFEEELKRYNLKWCRGGCEDSYHSHKRGFVLRKDKTTVHFDSEIARRSTLHGALHEIAHCILDERGMRRYQKEQQANDWAENRMKELGVSVPHKTAELGRQYVSRLKDWGDKIAG